MAKDITVTKATEVFQDILRFVKPGDPPEEHNALMLGIEAFNRLQEIRSVETVRFGRPLPGEAEE